MLTKDCKAHLAHLTLPVEWLQCPPWPHWGTPDPAHFPPRCARKFCTHSHTQAFSEYDRKRRQEASDSERMLHGIFTTHNE